MVLSDCAELGSLRWPKARHTCSGAFAIPLLAVGISAYCANDRPAGAFLRLAEEHDAGLLVMGAYSHSRLREMLLGGATRHILKNASARPVILAH
jgi:hypothetical protein